jgi:hypothetical protein
MPNSSYRLFDTAMLMSSSHRHLIICFSPDRNCGPKICLHTSSFAVLAGTDLSFKTPCHFSGWLRILLLKGSMSITWSVLEIEFQTPTFQNHNTEDRTQSSVVSHLLCIILSWSYSPDRPWIWDPLTLASKVLGLQTCSSTPGCMLRFEQHWSRELNELDTITNTVLHKFIIIR